MLRKEAISMNYLNNLILTNIFNHLDKISQITNLPKFVMESTMIKHMYESLVFT